MAAADELTFDFPPLIRVYRGGRVERLLGNDRISTGTDAANAVTSKDVDITADVSVRLYLPKISADAARLPVVVYFHGGGFVVESAKSPPYHRFLNALSSAAPAVAVSVEYRLAPEHPIPAGYDDSRAALDWVFAAADPWLAEHGDLARVFLAGDSAGGNIAHNMAMSSGHRVRGIVLLHPWFWGVDAVGNETTDPVARAQAGGLWNLICPGADGGVDDPRINPISARAPGLDGLACDKVMVCVAAEDFLVDRGRAYAEAARRSRGAAGGVEFVETESEGHVFFLFKPECDKAKELLDRIVRFVNGD